MHFATRSWPKLKKRLMGKWRENPKLIGKKVLAVIPLLIVVCVVLIPFSPPGVDAHHGPHHRSKRLPVQTTCSHMTFSSDGDPFPLCPGPFPRGGNCVWWAWEQWHLLGYNLPTNWGDPAIWVADATQSGLSVGTTPRVAAIAIFPRADGVWAFGPEGHAAFVTAVTNGGKSFNVTYQDYGDPVPMYVGVGYSVSIINQPRYQDGLLRFIYFPHPFAARRFSRLPGIVK
jgi:hypothetical protein